MPLKNKKTKQIEELSEEQKFLNSLKKANKGYIWAIVIAGIIATAAIICSVHYRVSLGALLLILSAVTYLAIVINLLYSTLGIAYKAYHGGMTITAFYGKDREVVYVPDKIMLLTVTEIGTKAFTHESSKSIKEIHLPNTLLRIGASAFAKLPALTDVYFEGSEEEWAKISELAPLENVTLHFNAPIPKIQKPKKDKKSKKDKNNKKDKKIKRKQ